MAADKMDMKTRTRRFASSVIRLFCDLPREREEVAVLGRQMLRCGTTAAAGYREAFRSGTDEEFIKVLETCAKEADEAIFWMELIRDDARITTVALDQLIQEAGDLVAVFEAMAKNVRTRGKDRK